MFAVRYNATKLPTVAKPTILLTKLTYVVQQSMTAIRHKFSNFISPGWKRSFSERLHPGGHKPLL